MLWLVLALGCSCGSKPEMEAVPTPAKVKVTPKKRVLLSFDDVPAQAGKGGAPTLDETQRGPVNAAILEELNARQVPAIGFVNCDNVGEGQPHLRRWHAGGLALGNHTSSHLPATQGTVEEWTDDVVRCERMLADITGEENHWFRFPYLKRGPQDRKTELMAALDELRLTVVPVTAATSEWYLASRYRDAEDDATRAKLQDELVKHMSWSLDEAYRQAQQRFGRDDVVHITLFHVNALTADTLPRVLDRLSEDGWTFVDVDTAMADPLYAMEDQVDADASLSWLYRAKPLGVEERYPFGEAERELKVTYGQ